MRHRRTIDPDEIFLDSTNLPKLDTQQFEGQLEQPIRKSAFFALGIIFSLIGAIFLARIFQLEVSRGAALAERSRNNTLRQIPIFAERGVIFDRLNQELAWNDEGQRAYIQEPGFGHLLGYLSYPTEEELTDQKFQPKELIGRDGAEKAFNDHLQGERGVKIAEVDVAGQIQSDYLLTPPKNGQNVTLSVDARLQKQLHRYIADLIDAGRFEAGAGVILDVRSGELLALVSNPEYDPNVLSLGEDSDLINAYLNNPRHPFLNRAVKGLYTPGSIVKPIIALGALTENIISPEKKILSTGSISVPNPYFPDQPSVFKDWKAHGWVDLRQAIAVSSNVYFYTVGGGFGDQAGLGIANIEKYAKLLGLGQATGLNFLGEEDGLVPSPEWKARTFPDGPWVLGDTYHTAIGQYGFQVTPLQMARMAAAIGNGGRLVTPTVLKTDTPTAPAADLSIIVKPESFQVVREGMRRGVLEGTGSGLNLPNVAVAAKTGTAELGVSKEEVNSWAIGFFPYETPRYAFAVVMEKGNRGNVIGSVFVMRQLFDWMTVNAPEYFE